MTNYGFFQKFYMCHMLYLFLIGLVLLYAVFDYYSFFFFLAKIMEWLFDHNIVHR